MKKNPFNQHISPKSSFFTPATTTTPRCNPPRQKYLNDFLPSSSSQKLIDTYGDFPTKDKNSANFRLLYSNVNGLSTINLEQECHQIGTTADAYLIDCLGLVETNINWKHLAARNKVLQTFKKYWNKTIIHTSSTPSMNAGIYQPGGTLTLLGNRWTGGARSYEDPSGLGRWTEIRLQGRQERQLIIITTYRVPQTTITSAGPSTSFYHQWHHLRRQGDQNPDPRAQLLHDLGVHIQALKASTTAILILMDANEAYHERHSPLQSWITTQELKDVHMYLHHHDTHISTYNRGSKRIDYAFATTNILPYIHQGGILPFHFLTTTDHRALQKYLRCQEATLFSQVHRHLSSNHPRGVVRYTQQLESWLDNHPIEQELEELTQHSTKYSSTHLRNTLETIDNSFAQARFQAEQGLHKYSRHPWPPKLKEAQLTVYY